MVAQQLTVAVFVFLRAKVLYHSPNKLLGNYGILLGLDLFSSAQATVSSRKGVGQAKGKSPPRWPPKCSTSLQKHYKLFKVKKLDKIFLRFLLLSKSLIATCLSVWCNDAFKH